jgi:hypothetical protein
VVREGIAFQIGDDEMSYFVLYRQHFENAAWVSREHRFFVVEMRGAQIGVSADRAS